MAEEKVVAATPVAPEAKPQAAHPQPGARPAFGARPQGDRRPSGDRPRGPRREREVKEYEERVVSINRVSKTVKGGRHLRFAAVVVIGDGKGQYGFGTGKAGEVPDAIKKALENAKKKLYKISLAKGDTISHEIIGQFGACSVFLKPAPEGTGVIAGGPVRIVMEMAGVKDISSKVLGSNNKLLNVRCAIKALNELKK